MPGYKLFAPFERLLAATLNEFYSEQIAAIFTDAAARDLAIPAPILGQPAYLTGLGVLTRWNGSVWKSVSWSGGQPYAAITASVDQTGVVSGALTAVTMPTVLEDARGFALGSNVLTVPAGLAGLYRVDAAVDWSDPGATFTGYRDIRVRRNGTLIWLTRMSGPPEGLPHLGSQIHRLAAADVIGLDVLHTQGANLILGARSYAPRLELTRIGD